MIIAVSYDIYSDILCIFVAYFFRRDMFYDLEIILLFVLSEIWYIFNKSEW